MYLFVFHSVFLIGASSAAAARLVATLSDRLIATFVVAWTNIVVTCLLLASLHRLGDSGWFLRTSLVLAALTWFLLRRRAPAAPAPRAAGERFSPALVAVFCLSLAPIAWANLRIAATYAPNNFDSLAYHLPRAMFYLGQGTLAHFDTGNDRQLFFPFNYNLLQAFGFVHGAPLQAQNFFNLATWAMAGIAVYRLSRLCACTPNAGLVATWLALTSTQILAQATATTNDLPTGAALLGALVFALRWRETRIASDATIAGLALGLGVGSKLTVIFFAPVVGLIGAGWLLQSWRTGRLPAFFAGVRGWIWPGLVAVALASPFAIVNLVEKGKWVTNTYDYTLNRPFKFASSIQTAEAYLAQLFIEPVQRFTLDVGFTERLNAWGSRVLFPHWNGAYAFSPFYLFPPDLNEDHVWFGFTGAFVVLVAIGSLLRFRRVSPPVLWLAALGLGWFATYFLLNKWSLYNQRYFVLPVLVLCPGLAVVADARLTRPLLQRGLHLLLALLALSALWMSGIYLFKNSSRSYEPFWSGYVPPPALPALPPVMAQRLAEQRRINIDTADGNERIFLLMSVGEGQRFTASAHVRPGVYNVFSEWRFPRRVAYSNIEQTSSHTIVPVAGKHTAGIEFLGTIGTGVAALDYYGLAPEPDQTAATDRDSNILVKLLYAPREPGRYAGMRIKVAGLNAPDRVRLRAEVEYADGSIAPLVSFTASGEQPAPITRPFRRILLRAEKLSDGQTVGSTAIPYLFRVLPPEIDVPDSPDLLFADELVLPKPVTSFVVTGLAAPEGPYPPRDLPLVRWAKSPVVRIEIPPTRLLDHLEFEFSARLQVRSAGSIDVVFNGEPVANFALGGRDKWVDGKVRLTPAAGTNVIELRNVVVSDEPDWLDYLERYPDVKAYVVAQGIPLEQGARRHWESFGHKETRTLHMRRSVVTLDDPAQLYYLFRSIRIFGYRQP
ncbi:MAG: glycosyltransferase family 39 protein [Opitutae bacterium]|nr:glycosyltransferase family 39 protein [Opitutae bacterium]